MFDQSYLRPRRRRLPREILGLGGLAAPMGEIGIPEPVLPPGIRPIVRPPDDRVWAGGTPPWVFDERIGGPNPGLKPPGGVFPFPREPVYRIPEDPYPPGVSPFPREPIYRIPEPVLPPGLGRVRKRRRGLGRVIPGGPIQ